MLYAERIWTQIPGETRKVVVLTLGSLEQHGHHLPMLTDTMIGTEIAKRAEAALAADVPPNEEIIDQIKRTLAANKMRDGVHIRLTLTRGVKVTSGMDPRLNRRGPTLIVLAEHKAPSLFEDRPVAHHEQHSAATAGDPRSANSPREPAQFDPGEDRSEQRRRR